MSSHVSPALRERALARLGIAVQHQVRVDAGDAEADEAGARREPELGDAFCSDAISTAAEPSTICDEFPAVTTPSGMNAGWSDAIFSSVVSRIASSTANRVRVSVAVPPPSVDRARRRRRDDLLLEAPLVASAARRARCDS